MRTREQREGSIEHAERAAVNALRQRREADRSKGLAELMERRPDLLGVHGPADLAAAAVRWCA